MTLHQLLHFYLGDAEAIRLLAVNPWTLAIGALLVFTAGLARHHDTHDLRREWWRLLVPFVAATLAAAGLGGLLVAISRAPFLDVTRPILGLIWLTAPFAWLYGFPFERLSSPARAALARRCVFGLVASARILLLALCVGELLGYTAWAGFLLVIGFAVPAFLLAMGLLSGWHVGETLPHSNGHELPARADTAERPKIDESAAGSNVGQAPRRVVDAMSGVTWPAHERITPPPDRAPAGPQDWGCLFFFLSWLTFAIALLTSSALIGPPSRQFAPMAADARAPGFDVWLTVGLALTFWILCAARHQPAQRLRTEFRSRLETSRDFTATLRELDHAYTQLPPQWAVGAEVSRTRLLEAACAAGELPAGSSVRESILTRFGFLLPCWLDSEDIYLEQDDRMTAAQLQELRKAQQLLDRIPEGKSLARPYEDYLVELIAYTAERDPPRAEILRNLLTSVLKRGPGRVD